jgi:hypothetical protein
MTNGIRAFSSLPSDLAETVAPGGNELGVDEPKHRLKLSPLGEPEHGK